MIVQVLEVGAEKHPTWNSGEQLSGISVWLGSAMVDIKIQRVDGIVTNTFPAYLSEKRSTTEHPGGNVDICNPRMCTSPCSLSLVLFHPRSKSTSLTRRTARQRLQHSQFHFHIRQLHESNSLSATHHLPQAPRIIDAISSQTSYFT